MKRGDKSIVSDNLAIDVFNKKINKKKEEEEIEAYEKSLHLIGGGKRWKKREKHQMFINTRCF